MYLDLLLFFIWTNFFIYFFFLLLHLLSISTILTHFADPFFRLLVLLIDKHVLKNMLLFKLFFSFSSSSNPFFVVFSSFIVLSISSFSITFLCLCITVSTFSIPLKFSFFWIWHFCICLKKKLFFVIYISCDFETVLVLSELHYYNWTTEQE